MGSLIVTPHLCVLNTLPVTPSAFLKEISLPPPTKSMFDVCWWVLF